MYANIVLFYVPIISHFSLVHTREEVDPSIEFDDDNFVFPEGLTQMIEDHYRDDKKSDEINTVEKSGIDNSSCQNFRATESLGVNTEELDEDLTDLVDEFKGTQSVSVMLLISSYIYLIILTYVSISKDYWMKVAIAVKKGQAGVHWSEEELNVKNDSLINSKDYDASQQSLLKRFFATLSDYGGPKIAQLSDILVDGFGETTRLVCKLDFLFYIYYISYRCKAFF